MKKTFALIAKKAMVYALTAAMLVSTPLTASAAEADYSDAFVDFELTVNPDSEYKQPTGSGTDTVTSSDTKSLVDADQEGLIAGIYLDPDEIYMTSEEGKNTCEVTATILFNKESNKDEDQVDSNLVKLINKSIKWYVKGLDGQNTSAIGISTPYKTTVVDEKGKTVGVTDRTKVKLRAKHGGRAVLTCALDSREYDIHYTATANVVVKETAAHLKLDDLAKAYVNWTYEMKDSLHFLDAENKEITTATDDIIWYVSNSKLASITQDGTLKINKYDQNNKSFKVTAVSADTGEKAEATVTTDPGTPAMTVNIIDPSDNNKKLNKKTKKFEVKQDTDTISVVAEMWTKAGSNGTKNEGITDKLTWSVDKPGIVKISPNGLNCTITAKNVGKAKVTAKATSGKNAYFTVNVAPVLQSVTVSDGGPLYTGQSMQVNIETVPSFFPKDKVTYSLKGSNDSKYAQVKKGILTAKAVVLPEDLGGACTVTVAASGGRKYPDAKESTGTYNIEQSQILAIEIENKNGDVVARKDLSGVTDENWSEVKNSTDTVYTVTDEVKPIVVYDATTKEPSAGYSPLQWTSAKKAIAAVNNEGELTALKPGKSKITVTGYGVVTKNNKKKVQKVAVSFTAKVVQPATSLKLDKSSVIINKNNAKKTYAVKATVTPKNATPVIKWKLSGSDVPTGADIKPDRKTTKGTLTIPGKAGEEGKSFAITAKDASGAYKVISAKITQKTDAVVIASKDDKTKVKDNLIKGTKTMSVGGKLDIYPMIQIGKDTRNTKAAYYNPAENSSIEGVTYKYSKPGYVNVVGNELIALQPTGRSTITVTVLSESGAKKASFKVKIQ